MDDDKIKSVIADLLSEANDNADKELNSKEFIQARFNRAHAIAAYIDIKGEKFHDMHESASELLAGAFTEKEIEGIKVLILSLLFTLASDRDILHDEMRMLAGKLAKMGNA